MITKENRANIFKQIAKIGNEIISNHQVFKIDRITENGLNIPSNKYGCDIYSEDDMFSFDHISLVKTPLDEITDEDASFVASIVGFDNTLARFTPPASVRIGKRMISDLFVRFPNDVTTPCEALSVFHYLESKNYAIPVYLMNIEKNKYRFFTEQELFELKIYQKK